MASPVGKGVFFKAFSGGWQRSAAAGRRGAHRFPLTRRGLVLRTGALRSAVSSPPPAPLSPVCPARPAPERRSCTERQPPGAPSSPAPLSLGCCYCPHPLSGPAPSGPSTRPRCNKRMPDGPPRHPLTPPLLPEQRRQGGVCAARGPVCVCTSTAPRVSLLKRLRAVERQLGQVPAVA